jgi:hypothetical protein
MIFGRISPINWISLGLDFSSINIGRVRSVRVTLIYGDNQYAVADHAALLKIATSA